MLGTRKGQEAFVGKCWDERDKKRERGKKKEREIVRNADTK